MITPRDKDYKDTKLIKQGKKKLVSPFKELAEWISMTFEVNVLNVYYDRTERDNRPIINVIFEYKLDERRFLAGDFGNYDPSKRKAITDKFKEFVEHENLLYDTKNISVIFSSFNPIAMDEANGRIPEEKIQELKIKINNRDLWEITRRFSFVTFFFYTDKQVEENLKIGMREKLSEEYYKVLKLYDEFGYFKSMSSSLAYMDSKENFDNNYQSNWYYYYK